MLLVLLFHNFNNVIIVTSGKRNLPYFEFTGIFQNSVRRLFCQVPDMGFKIDQCSVNEQR